MAGLAPHETLELNELISMEASEIKKLRNNLSNVRDEDLRNYMEKCLNAKKGNLESLQKFVETVAQQQ